MSEQEQNRTEAATPFKLQEAKKQGQVAKSLDFNSFVILGALLLMLMVWGGNAMSRLAHLSSWLLEDAARLQLEQPADAAWLGELMLALLGVVLPFAAVSVAFAILANLLQTGPIFTFVPLKPKFERISPVAGFKRVFNKRMLFEALKTLLKLSIFAVILYGFLRSAWPTLSAVAIRDVRGQMSWLAEHGTTLLLRLGLAMLAFGLLDFAYARWQYRKQMMMSQREVKEEVKRREGDPLIRAKIRELQRKNLKQAKSLSRVPEADVLITNPEHIAIALKYVRTEMNAPIVIAKGSDSWAVSMRALAHKHAIPMLERRKLARHLFKFTQIDQPIPADSFIDVARVYAEIEARRRQLAQYEVVP